MKTIENSNYIHRRDYRSNEEFREDIEREHYREIADMEYIKLWAIKNGANLEYKDIRSPPVINKNQNAEPDFLISLLFNNKNILNIISRDDGCALLEMKSNNVNNKTITYKIESLKAAYRYKCCISSILGGYEDVKEIVFLGKTVIENMINISMNIEDDKIFIDKKFGYKPSIRFDFGKMRYVFHTIDMNEKYNFDNFNIDLFLNNHVKYEDLRKCII